MPKMTFQVNPNTEIKQFNEGKMIIMYVLIKWLGGINGRLPTNLKNIK